MKNTIEKIKQNRFQDFKGARIKVKIPLPEPLINEAIAENLQGGAIQQFILTILPDNELQVQVSTTVKLLFKAKISRKINIQLRDALPVDEQFNTVAEIESIEGGLGRTEETLIQLLSKKINKDLPNYVAFSGHDLKINAYDLLVDYGMESIVDHIDQLYITTEITEPAEPNKIWIEAAVRI